MYLVPLAYPVAQEHVGRFCAAVRSQTDETFECRMPYEVGPGLAD